MSTGIDTGDNLPVDLGSLERAMRYCIDEGAKFLKGPLKDSTGEVYAYSLLSPDRQPFYMVCKSSKLFKPRDPEFEGKSIVSVQRQLVTPIALLNEYPILLVWWLKQWDIPNLRMYHPEEITVNWGHKINDRLGVDMINFPFVMGRRIYNIKILKRLWTEEMRRWIHQKPIAQERAKKQRSLTRFLKTHTS